MASNESHPDRLEQIVHVIAEDHLGLEEGQAALQKLIAELATETRRGFDRVAEQFAETDRRMRETDQRIEKRFRETDERFRQTDERFRQTDERIEKLVSAIVEMFRRPNG